MSSQNSVLAWERTRTAHKTTLHQRRNKRPKWHISRTHFKVTFSHLPTILLTLLVPPRLTIWPGNWLIYSCSLRLSAASWKKNLRLITLLRAMTNGVFLFSNSLSDSIVCGSNPCIMSTTRMAKSQSDDPRERRFLKRNAVLQQKKKLK